MSSYNGLQWWLLMSRMQAPVLCWIWGDSEAVQGSYPQFMMLTFPPSLRLLNEAELMRLNPVCWCGSLTPSSGKAVSAKGFVRVWAASSSGLQRHSGLELQLLPGAQHHTGQGKELMEPLLFPLPLKQRPGSLNQSRGSLIPSRAAQLLPWGDGAQQEQIWQSGSHL